jgi:hypothetical protein
VADDPLSEVATELYMLPPEQFVAARDEAVKRAKATGDRRLAVEIGKLRRPTVAAWVVNRLAHQRPEMVGELLALGEAFRAAQRNLRGDELRELSQQRRAMVSALAREAVGLARREYRRDNLPVAEIEATLMAALADPDVAAAVRSGQLVRTVEYTGFGEPPRPQLRLLRGGTAKSNIDDGRSNAISYTRTGPDRPTSMKEREAAEREAAERAEAERREAERDRLRRARAAAHRELLAARTDLADAEAARTEADRAVTAARRRVEKATAALNALERDEDADNDG